jgi:hypothetical protein
MPKLSADALFTLGFEDVGQWKPGATATLLAYVLDASDATTQRRILDTPNALYAFLLDDEVLYVGKTSRGIRRRFRTYCTPGSRQSTNIKNNSNIRQLIAAGRTVRIAIFTPISHLRYGDFEIDLAAGLENALIANFVPRWNGKDGGHPVSESAAREITDDEGLSVAPDPPVPWPPSPQPKAAFQIKLGDTYYDRGIINPGVDASRFLGPHGTPVFVCLGDYTNVVASSINRTANSSGAARISDGNQQIAAWFQQHYARGNIVNAQVLDEDRIMLQLPALPA